MTTTLCRCTPWLLVLLLLTGCTLPGVREGNSTDLGATRAERPGDVYAQMGQAYMDEGQRGVALRKLKYGLQVDPDNARIHAVLGMLYQRLGESEPAQTHFARASELEPQNPYFRNAWGGFLCQQGELQEADRQFRLALQNPLYDRPWQASTNAGLCALRAGDTARAEEYLRRALSTHPGIPQALAQMARIELERGDLQAAHGYLERYAQVAPHTADTLLLGARIGHARARPDDLDHFRQALETRFPDAPETQTARELKLP
jgi:type IV pilus assembly protein PilF